MSSLLEVVIDVGELVNRALQAGRLLSNPTPIMRGIAGTLESVTEGNFEAQGRPHWAPLSKATLPVPALVLQPA